MIFDVNLLTRNLKKKKKHYERFMEKVVTLVEIMEHRQKAR